MTNSLPLAASHILAVLSMLPGDNNRLPSGEKAADEDPIVTVPLECEQLLAIAGRIPHLGCLIVTSCDSMRWPSGEKDAQHRTLPLCAIRLSNSCPL